MFDPYHKWLGISPKEQPPNHYRLLALAVFEPDLEVIDSAANRQMAYVQQRATGEHAAESQKLLNELSAARLCLLNREKKAAYDTELKAKLGTFSKETTGSQPGPVQPEPPANREEARQAKMSDVRSTPKQSAGKSSSPQRLPKILLASGTCATLVVAVILWIVFGRGTKTDDSGSIADPTALASGDATGAGKRSSANENSTVPAGQQTTTSTGPERPAKQPNQLAPSDSQTPVASQRELPKGAVLILTFDKDAVFSQDGKLHVRDLSERNLTGKIHDGSITDGRVGNGLLCQGRTYIQLDGSFPKAAEPRTLAAWIKKAEGPWKKIKHILTYGNSENAKNRVFGIMFADDTWRFYDNSGGLDSGTPIDENWHHHCVAYDGTTLKYYLDSKLVASGDKSLDTDDGPFVVGACVNRTVHFLGVIDEVALFDRALSGDEVGTLYQMGCTGIPLKGPASEKNGDSSGSNVLGTIENGGVKAEPEGRPIIEPGNVALASNGTTVTGPSGGVEYLLDGRSDDPKQYAQSKLNHPWIITLPKTYLLQCIHFELWGAKQRYYQYQLEVSSDGRSFDMLADRTTGEWSGWQTITFPKRPVKAIRLTGTYCSKNNGIHVIEFEAYCTYP